MPHNSSIGQLSVEKYILLASLNVLGNGEIVRLKALPYDSVGISRWKRDEPTPPAVWQDGGLIVDRVCVVANVS